MTFLLMVFLAVVCLFEGYPAQPWGGPRWAAAALTGVALLGIAVHAAFLSVRTCRRIAAGPAGLDRHLAEYDRARFSHNTMTMVLFLVSLVVFGWGWFVRGADARVSGPGTELFLLAPFILGQ